VNGEKQEESRLNDSVVRFTVEWCSNNCYTVK